MAGINQDETAFSAYLENMGAYVQNKSRGHWVDFPVPLERLAGIRAEIGGEEQIILDYDIPEKYAFLQDAVSEYSNLEQLNLAGAILQRLSEQSLEAVEAYAASGGALGLLELMNLMVQADDIPYFPYQFEGIENVGEMSAEEAYGYMKVENQMQDLQEVLGKYSIEHYLDYEAIGRDANLSGEADLYDKGYVDMAADGPDLGLYTMDELKAEYGMARETVQDPQKEAQGMDRQEELRGPSI